MKNVIHKIEINDCLFQHFIKVYGKIWVGFCLNTGKPFFLEVFLKLLSKANVKKNRMGSINWTKLNRVLPVTALLFQKSYFSLRTLYKEVIWCSNQPSVHFHTFQKHWSFIWGFFFSVSILKFAHDPRWRV